MFSKSSRDAAHRRRMRHEVTKYRAAIYRCLTEAPKNSLDYSLALLVLAEAGIEVDTFLKSFPQGGSRV